jgi:hypothetical protein
MSHDIMVNSKITTIATDYERTGRGGASRRSHERSRAESRSAAPHRQSPSIVSHTRTAKPASR